MLRPFDADTGISPATLRLDMLPQWPIWIETAAPSLWTASVMRRRSGTISGRSHSWRLNERPLRWTDA